MSNQAELLEKVRDRWGLVDPKQWWFLSPCRVKILLYADFAGAYNGGSFGGLKEVQAVLQADPYFWVSFEVAKANRGGDPSADADKQSKTLDQLNLSDYDELWLFGFGSGASVLSAAELQAVTTFMDAGKGVLVTGDHAGLGGQLASAIPRVGKMRNWAAPDAGSAGQFSTLREGPTAGFVFNDQSDDVPQTLRLRRYPLWSFGLFNRRYMPHPVMCGPTGPIKTFPDHQHEGEILENFALNAAEWPSSGGFQPKPEVVAWGHIIDPNTTSEGREIGVVGTYNGHSANVGRIVADSTWHHWFDINLIGIGGAVGGSTGFNASPQGQAVLKQIEAYFLNVAIWLAPPGKQKCMFSRATWGVIWKDPLVMLPIDLPILILGETARDSLGRYAPQCTIRGWLWELLPVDFWQRLDKFKLPIPFDFDDLYLGSIVKVLLTETQQHHRQPDRIPNEEIEKIVTAAAKTALPMAGKELTRLTLEAQAACTKLVELIR